MCRYTREVRLYRHSLYSFVTLRKIYSDESLDKIRDFEGLKILFIQDEYRRVDFVCDKIKYARIDLVFTCAPPDVASQIYVSLEGKVALSTTLTGYVPEKLSSEKEAVVRASYRHRISCPQVPVFSWSQKSR